MINIGMATVPSRFHQLQMIVPSLLKQCDKMFIHVNGASDCPTFLKKEKKIRLTFSNRNKGGQMALRGVPQTSGYYFCVDDDLLYPDDYVDKMITFMKKYDDQVIACVHGSNFNAYAPVRNVFKNKTEVYVSYKGLTVPRRVMIPGVGTACMHTKSFSISPMDFAHKNMRDAVVACKAAKEGISVVAIDRGENWIKKIPVRTEIAKNQAYHGCIDQLIAKHLPYFKQIPKG
ncbi:glycosyltransferase [Salicibibacter halophilus]|uniref:Glycosyltransferase n=1 Tax=Salicibibacter halophilus TaxID=2502791 RepID=A0A514LLX4_9BACI|nr:glycosyltransferase [Salicibibacter halophilus]QDI92864.1 glycosyltransferase [Salicibibacter halophilus]